MSYIEKEKLIKADLISIENRVRHAFNQGYDLGFKDGKEKAKPQEQESILDKIRAEIEEKYGDYDICEWFEDYDYEENDISEYQQVGDVSDILAIIDKYKEESEVNNGDSN